MKPIRMRKIRQVFVDKKIENIPEIVSKEFERIGMDNKIKPGMNIGITVGSRGIRNLKTIIQSVIQEVRQSGGKPFILTSMGSHGGATAEGQVKVLEKLGITEANMGGSD